MGGSAAQGFVLLCRFAPGVMDRSNFMENVWSATPIIIVSYRTFRDLAACLTSLDGMQAEPAFSVHICENGGATAFDDLCETLGRPDGPCTPDHGAPASFDRTEFVRVRRLLLRNSKRPVLIGEAPENLGYAGGINAWLLPMLRVPGWNGCWILNPDTLVAPDALSELAAWAAQRKLGMVGTRLLASPTETLVTTMGLRWRRWLGRGLSIGRGTLASIEPNAEKLEAEIEAVTGASFYVSRDCAEALAPLDERYFLFFEDFDWGVRARHAGQKLGYAHKSLVVHSGGSSIGSPSRRKVGSPLAIYMDFRNSILFVRTHYPEWLAWTAMMSCLHALRLLRQGRFLPAVRGLLAGLKGETGRPAPDPRLGLECDARGRRPSPEAPQVNMVRIVKAIISIFWLAATRTYNILTGRGNGARLTILYYHAIRADSLASFRWQLSAIKAYGDVVPPDYVGECGSRPKVAITFDDGFQSVFDTATPEMLAQDVPFTVFVPTSCIGGAPTWEMEGACTDRDEILASEDTLRAAALIGVRFGAHARTHPILTKITPHAAHKEIHGSKADLERVLGATVDLFSFPYGDFNKDILSYCKEAGYRFAYSTLPATLDSTDVAMLRPRVAVDPSDTRLEFWLKLRGAYAWMKFASSVKSEFRNLLSPFRSRWRQGTREV